MNTPGTLDAEPDQDIIDFVHVDTSWIASFSASHEYQPPPFRKTLELDLVPKPSTIWTQDLESLQSAGRFSFFSIDNNRPLCGVCSRLMGAELISMDGATHHGSGAALSREHEHSPGCPLCSTLRDGFISYIHDLYDKTPSEESPYDEYKFKEDRIRALNNDPVRIFLNPLMTGGKYDEKTSNEYRLRKIWAWSGYPELLDAVELHEFFALEGTEYYSPTLKRSASKFSFGDARPGEQLRKARALAATCFYPTTYWSDPIANTVTYKHVVPDMMSKEVVDMIHHWMETCLTSHASCRPLQIATIPTRLIDIGDSHTPARVILTGSLVQPENSCKSPPKYVALSYCWGKSDETNREAFTPTTSSTLAAHMKSLPIKSLPRTIVDAIILTRTLRLQYLWVDSLCILQGNDPMARADWSKESAIMSDVYGGAVITIAAAWGSSMHAGIVVQRPSITSSDVTIGLQTTTEPMLKGTIQLTKEMHQDTDPMDQPLYNRAWTLQERMLSTRVLICNRDQLIWECQSRCFTESGLQPRSLGAKRLDAALIAKLNPTAETTTGGSESVAWVFRDTWKRIVTDYCLRGLSEPGDKLPAVAGVAKRLHALRPTQDDVYLAGLWTHSLLDDLLWIHCEVDDRDRPSYDQQTSRQQTSRQQTSRQQTSRRKPSVYRAPSWSWAAVDGPVHWPNHYRSPSQPKYFHSTLLKYSVRPMAGSDSFGGIASASITLRGPLWKLPESLRQLICSQNPKDDNENRYRRLPAPFDYIRRPHMDVDTADCSLIAGRNQSYISGCDLFFLKIFNVISIVLCSPREAKAKSSSSLEATLPDVKMDTLEDSGIGSDSRTYQRLGLVYAWDKGLPYERYKEYSQTWKLYKDTICTIV
ncbi:heterokaryon incompatibility protein-domain-containing protein [Phaeosphaeria sp. MPI-PUGE-AT-0046c]|nr:heterokaryon incompatibility protein-domain-containing protein [Phaeosphaeria sp. MPI-PUGE-AT-0046c]